VLIPASVEKIDYAELWQWRGAAQIEVAKDNPFFQSVDGSLLGKDGETPISCCVSSVDNSAILPDGTKKIDAKAFGVCRR